MWESDTETNTAIQPELRSGRGDYFPSAGKFSESEWQAEKAAYEQEVSRITEPYLEMKSRQKQDPVIDFIFTYYSYSPARLRKWSPGAGVLLEEADSERDFDRRFFTAKGNGLIIPPESLPSRKTRGLRWMAAFLESVENRSPNLSCCGMHEWAMVYEADEVRHSTFPLRLSRSEIRDLVEEHPVNCTHFDAFRFFTPKARPLNSHALSRESMDEFEQPGCLHANMDLYKWSYKLSPWVPGSLLLDCFHLACKARVLDMKAGPYDLREIGYEPVCIETAEGRKEYRKQQTIIWQESIPLRSALKTFMNRLLSKQPATAGTAPALSQ